MNRSRKDVTLMAVIGALLLFAVFNFVFKPQRSELSAARGDLQQMEQSVSDAELQLGAPVATTVPDPAKAAPSAIPADPAESNLLRQLHSIAETTGVALTSISPTPLGINPSGPGGSLQLSITATGPHKAVQAYLQQLRDMERLVVIEQVGLTSQAATDLIGPTDQLQLSVRVFTLQPPAIAPSATPTSAP